MATHSSILAWRIPWTEEPSWLQSMGSKVGNGLSTKKRKRVKKKMPCNLSCFCRYLSIKKCHVIFVVSVDICLSLCQYHAALVTVASHRSLCYLVGHGPSKCLLFYFLLKVSWQCSCLVFQRTFRINLSSSKILPLKF